MAPGGEGWWLLLSAGEGSWCPSYGAQLKLILSVLLLLLAVLGVSH